MASNAFRWLNLLNRRTRPVSGVLSPYCASLRGCHNLNDLNDNPKDLNSNMKDVDEKLQVLNENLKIFNAQNSLMGRFTMRQLASSRLRQIRRRELYNKRLDMENKKFISKELKTLSMLKRARPRFDKKVDITFKTTAIVYQMFLFYEVSGGKLSCNALLVKALVGFLSDQTNQDVVKSLVHYIDMKLPSLRKGSEPLILIGACFLLMLLHYMKV